MQLGSLAQSRYRLDSTAMWGLFWLAVATAGAAVFFAYGGEALIAAWSKPEYSHGPLIPILSLLLFLRQLKDVPVQIGEIPNRWPGVAVMVFSVCFGLVGHLAHIADVTAYAIIIWVWGVLLTSFGWRTGLLFWPPVLHLVYMLPLPDTFYYKLSTYLQFVSSELGVQFLRWLNVPVFLEGNIIDLGVFRLHVAEACSGLRYLFPILSFSYIFAVLYKGPMWHKAILLVSAAPITVFMNSVRIAIAGVIVNHYGVEWVDGFTHFFEGWVIFLACVLILFALAWVLLFLRRDRLSLVDALDLDTSGLGTQAKRITLVQPSKALVTGALFMAAVATAWQLVPERDGLVSDRDPFAIFPSELGDWRAGLPTRLEPGIEERLGADDYHQVDMRSPEWDQSVGLFMAWYADQSQGGIHSPEICLPAAGWEIAWLERTDISDRLGWTGSFDINRAIIQKGTARMMVYYWFEQRGRKVAWDLAAKFYLLRDGVVTGKTDGAIVRLTTLIGEGETDSQAEARLIDALSGVLPPLSRYIPQS